MQGSVSMDMFFPICLAVKVGSHDAIDKLLMRMTDRHEEIDLVVSRHENLFDFIESHGDSLVSELYSDGNSFMVVMSIELLV